MSILLTILIGFAAGAAAPWIEPLLRRWTGWVLAAAPLAAVALLSRHLPIVSAGESTRVAWAWVPGIDVELGFLVDGLGLLFALLISLIGALILIYSSDYMSTHQYRARFYCFLLMFMASMIGFVLADNVFTLYIFFELTSLFSFFLIGLNGESAGSRRAARQALLVTNAGGLALLAGLLLMGQVGGTYTISELLLTGDILRESPLYTPILLLVLLGAFTKSAQIPFHFWLPNAMEAPTPVSAYLHSATMVKAGIYLLARFSPTLGGTMSWHVIVATVGGATMLLSAWLALRHCDLKRILAYSTLMALGLIVMLLGVGTRQAVTAAVFYIVIHAFYKATLFMVAGAIDHGAGSRDVTRLGGLRKVMPWCFAAAVLAALSMSGMPPFFGFIGKEYIYETLGHSGAVGLGLLAAVVLAKVAMAAVALIVVIRPFLGAPSELTAHAHGESPALFLGPLILGILSLAFGLWPTLLDAPLVAPAASAVFGEPVEVHFLLWHGWTIELALSVLTALAGIGIYLTWNTLRESNAMARYARAIGDLPDAAFEAGLRALAAFGTWQTRLIQGGRLSNYMATIVATAVLLTGAVFIQGVDFHWQPYPLSSVRLMEWLLVGIMVVAPLVLLRFESRLATILALSAVSYAIALLFLLFGAPDLAITQLLVETLMAVLVVLAFHRLPHLVHFSPLRRRMRDAVLAAMIGGIVTLLMLGVLSMPFDGQLGEWYAANSYPLAHGRNIVNVILVDFRALDTLGEITVICVAGISMYVLLRSRRSGDRKRGENES